jgi:hypothetical protein
MVTTTVYQVLPSAVGSTTIKEPATRITLGVELDLGLPIITMASLYIFLRRKKLVGIEDKTTDPLPPYQPPALPSPPLEVVHPFKIHS